MQEEKTGRNDSCPCGSGKKYKKCCLLSVLKHSDAIDPAWRELRQTEGDLQHDILAYVTKEFPKELFKIAWDSFFLNEEWQEELYNNVEDNFFGPWFLFDLDVKNGAQEQPIALHFLKRYYQRVTSKQRQFIETICQTHFSFYVVLDVVPKQSIKLKDILTEVEYTVKEYQASECVRRGDIMFSRILTLDGVSICVGTAPRIIPSQCHMALLDYRKELEAENTSPLTIKLLRSIGDDLRSVYFDIMEEQFNQPMPVLHNTDGDLFQFCTINFKLNISPDEAFNKLLPLTLSDDSGEFLSDAKKGKDGQLKKIKLRWLKAGNQKHKEWENTLMGDITIPALDGLTPMQATKTNDGKRKLEALLLDFENKVERNPDNISNPNVNELRIKLGLNK